MSEVKFSPLAAQEISEKWGLALSPQDLVSSQSYERILLSLSEVIERLLRTNPEKLIQSFYRMDVNEAKYQKILATNSPQDLPQKLAELVLERELQKIETRKKYQGK